MQTSIRFIQFDGNLFIFVKIQQNFNILAIANGPGDLGSIPARVIPKTLKMVLDITFLNTQRYKVRIMDKVEKSRERSSALPYTTM